MKLVKALWVEEEHKSVAMTMFLLSSGASGKSPKPAEPNFPPQTAGQGPHQGRTQTFWLFPFGTQGSVHFPLGKLWSCDFQSRKVAQNTRHCHAKVLTGRCETCHIPSTWHGGSYFREKGPASQHP